MIIASDNTVLSDRIHNSLILVVDDTDTNRAMLQRSLGSRGYNKVLMARDGAEALQITHDLKPDLVILDLVMPGMDGFAYCQAVRRDPLFDNMPILVQTMLEDMENKLKAFYLGASDYISKPIDPDELSARTQMHLTKKILMEDMIQHKKQIHAEMQAARAMQNRLMPDAASIAMCERIYDMKIAAHFETSSMLGGDCWGVRPIMEKKLAIYNYDFSGHGISAALNAFRIHTLMQECMHSAGDPGHFLEQMNQRLYPLVERNEFATMFYGVIDFESNCLQYATAACPSAVLYSHHGDNCNLLSGQGFPLGSVVNARYEKKFAPYLPQDMLMFFSDCVIETKNHQDEFITETQIMDCVHRSIKNPSSHPAQQVIHAMLSLLRSHQPQPIADDLTLSAYWRCAEQ